MAIDISINRAATTAAQTDFATNEGMVAQGAAAAPVLGGENVTVTNAVTSDLEKLVLQLKNETAEVRQSVAERRIAILTTVLDAMAERISEKEKQNLIEIETLNVEIADAKSEISEKEKALATAKNNSAALQTQIDALEKQIENAVKDGEDHRKQVEELKKQKAEEDAKIQDLTNAISSLQTKISGCNAKIATLTKEIGAATMSEVAAAVKAAAGEAMPAQDERVTAAENDKAEKKAAEVDVSATIRKALDRIDEEILRTLAENRTVKA